jgi:hypothetical protein
LRRNHSHGKIGEFQSGHPKLSFRIKSGCGSEYTVNTKTPGSLGDRLADFPIPTIPGWHHASQHQAILSVTRSSASLASIQAGFDDTPGSA